MIAFLKLLARNRLAAAGGIVLTIVVALALVTPLLPLQPPDVTNTANRFLPVGAYYCILARKRVYSRLPRKPAWRSQKVISLPARGAVGASRGYSEKSCCGE